jgi:hypothetical protein
MLLCKNGAGGLDGVCCVWGDDLTVCECRCMLWVLVYAVSAGVCCGGVT